MISDQDFSLHLAQAKKNPSDANLDFVFKAIIKKEVLNPNLSIDNGYSAAMLFSSVGSQAQIIALAESGLNLNAKTDNGFIAFDYAIANGNLDAIHYFLTKQRDIISHQDGLIMRTLASSCPLPKFQEALSMLAKYDININGTVPGTGKGAINYLLSRKNHSEIAECRRILEESGVVATKEASPANKRSNDNQPSSKERSSKNPRTESNTDGGYAAYDTYVNDNGELLINPRSTISHPAASSFDKIESSSIKK